MARAFLLLSLVGLIVVPPVAAQTPEGALCQVALQWLVDQADTAAIVDVPPCIYRESVRITRPVSLIAEPGAEIRGSDVWANWSWDGQDWIGDQLPNLVGHGQCANQTFTCTSRQQVYLDGQQLEQVAVAPSSGQWAADRDLRVVLSDDPTGHTIEVATRSAWIVVSADDVLIQGFKMQHAVNDAQTGALQSDGANNLTVRENELAYAHGADLAVHYGSGLTIVDNDLHHAGQEGLTGYQVSDTLIVSNTIHSNNLAGFDSQWEAGGLKLATSSETTLDGNRVHDNAGPGLWCDIGCRNVIFSNNDVHDNTGMGIFFEISNGAQIFGNTLSANAPGAHGDGMDIFVSSSQNADVHDNLLERTLASIVVFAEDRPDAPKDAGAGNTVHDNYVPDTSPDQ